DALPICRVPAELREPIFGQLIKRSESARVLVQALAEGKLAWTLLGPSDLHRLRTHSDAAVAAKANEVIDARRGPVQKEKDALIAQFRPVVERIGGNPGVGPRLFTPHRAPRPHLNQHSRAPPP